MRCSGEMQEWLNWPLSKSGKPQGFEGSNPSLSAKREATRLLCLVVSLLEKDSIHRFDDCQICDFTIGSQ